MAPLRCVGLSNILDSDLERRKPAEGPHGKVIGTVIVGGELIGEGHPGNKRKAVAEIKPLLIFLVAALCLVVVAGRVGTDELMWVASVSKSVGSRLLLENKPAISWDFHSLLLGIQMMLSFMLVDDEQPLRLRKHCQKVFWGSRSNAAFCSPRCKNQYNVYKNREKSKGEAN